MAATDSYQHYFNEKPFDDLRALDNESFDQNYFSNPQSTRNNSNNQNNSFNNKINMNNNNSKDKKSRKIIFYKNGDKYFAGKSITVTPSKYFSFRELMSDLNRAVDLPYGVRRVYTPVNGREIHEINELEDGFSYVCASFEPFRPAKYGDFTEKPWNARMQPPRQEVNGTNIPTQHLPSIHASYPNNLSNNTVTNQNQNQNYYLPRQYLKSIPLVANNNNNNGFMVNNSVSKRNGPNGQQTLNYKQGGGVATSDVWSKPRLITIVRATEKPRKKISILLNRKGLHSYEQFVCDISDAFGLPQWKNDKIRKLYTIRGKKVQGISDFFRDDDTFVGVGKESLTPVLVQDILEEIYQENPEIAQSLFNEWEATRLRSKPRYSSLENNSMQANETSPESNRKSYNFELDENGKRKRKKKMAESDIILEAESQRQKERVRLIEIERKKRELAGLSKSTDKENNKNNFNAKRVNIKTPPNAKELYNSDQLPNLDNKKFKRKPKFKKYIADESLDLPNQKNQTPSSVKNITPSGILIDENPPSRNINSKSPAPLVKDRITPNTTPRQNNEAKNELQVTPRQQQPKQSKQPTEVLIHDEHPTVKNPLNNTTNKKKEEIPNKIRRQISNASHVTDKYEYLKTLGDGNFAVVKQAKHKATDHEYAIKIIDKSKMKGKENMIENEIYIMKSCNHPNIVKLYEEFETKTEVFLVTDLVKGGDLFDAITQSVKFNEKDSSSMVKDLCEALFYLHSKNIVHRDLKPENLLVMRRKDDKITIKLADFGLAMEVKQPIYTVCGTPTYVAPEILSEIGYGLEVDMWACGVITYILLCGFPPFRSLDRNQDELFQYIQSGEFEYLMPYWEGISESSKDLINHLLVVDVKKRWKAQDVLVHPWIITQGNSKLIPSSYDEFKKEQLNDLKEKSKQYAAEPLVFG